MLLASNRTSDPTITAPGAHLKEDPEGKLGKKTECSSDNDDTDNNDDDGNDNYHYDNDDEVSADDDDKSKINNHQ